VSEHIDERPGAALFSCCIATVLADDGPDVVGGTMRCAGCDAPLVYTAEYGWTWDRAADVSITCIRKSIAWGDE
jgi:hypothetical protein